MDFFFEIMFYEANEFAFGNYESKIRVFFAEKLIRKNSVLLQEKRDKRLYRDLRSNIYRFDGKVVGGLDDKHLFDLLNVYCDDERLDNTLISLNPSNFDLFPCLKEKLKSRNERQLYSIAFGTIVNLNQFVSHVEFSKTYGALRVESQKAVFEHFKRQMLLEVHCQQHYTFVLNYSSISYIVLSKIAGNWSIYLVLSLPPLLYEVQKHGTEIGEIDEQFEGSKVIYSHNVTLARQVNIGDNFNSTTMTKSKVIHLNPWIRLNRSQRDSWKLIWSLVFNINRYSKTPIYIGKVETVIRSMGNPSLPLPRNLPFDVHYAFQCLLSTYQLHDELFVADETREFIDLLETCSQVDPKAIEEALYDLFWMKDNNIPVNCFYALKSRFEQRHNLAAHVATHDNIVELRRCVITPTRIIFLPPLPYMKSRLFRNSDPMFALRVYAKDENMEPLNFTVLGPAKHLNDFFSFNYFFDLCDGIFIKNRRYEYLGSSTSQLRDFGMIFYARDTIGRTAASLREDIGDLSHIKNPAKYIARLGQAFSQPIAHLPYFPRLRVTVEPDITGGVHRLTGNPYVFSDGIGMLSEDLAVELTSLIKKDRLIPFSAFQIRYGGSKGMVTINPHLTQKRMILRESMKKFESDSMSIEVLKVTEPRHTYLNRPMVNILEQLGVDSSVFLSVARCNFEAIIDSFSCQCKALILLKAFSIIKVDYEAIKNCGINIFGENYFRGILEMVVKMSIKEIKSKARIRLPEEFGRTMFGVLDETRTLKEGEVFVQYSKMDDYKSRKVVTGDVLVTKFPCMHPGDVRKFNAVDNAYLYHLFDCIVFPQCGSRPHPDQMAGSDLDGDEYAVIWEKSFLFPGSNKDAMDYSGEHENFVVEKVEVNDMLKFYIDFMVNNNVGTIATNHLSLSDRLNEGIFHENCIDLAKQYSVSLDFAKSGKIDTQPAHRANCYPDFMEKIETRPTYRSARALGKLYRLSCMFEENGEFEGILGEQTNGNDLLLTYPGWQLFEAEAEQIYYEYRMRINHIQRQFGVDDELSLLSGLNMELQKYICSKNERHDVFEMIRFLINDVIQEFRSTFESSFPKIDLEEVKEARKAKASAWYLVTRRLNQKNLFNQYNGLPWIVSTILCDIAKDKSKSAQGTASHVCTLGGNVIAANVTIPFNPQSYNQRLNGVERVLQIWFTNTLKSCRGYQYITETIESYYWQYLRYHAITVCRAEVSVEAAVERILIKLAAGCRSGGEFENMLALTALMTARRYQRTKLCSTFTQMVCLKDIEKETGIFCLSFEKTYFKNYVKYCEADFFQKLKQSGVEDVCIHVVQNQNSDKNRLFISAFGRKEYLKRLKNAIIEDTFYEEVVNNRYLNYN